MALCCLTWICSITLVIRSHLHYHSSAQQGYDLALYCLAGICNITLLLSRYLRQHFIAQQEFAIALYCLAGISSITLVIRRHLQYNYIAQQGYELALKCQGGFCNSSSLRIMYSYEPLIESNSIANVTTIIARIFHCIVSSIRRSG